jgi:hypothetical protein
MRVLFLTQYGVLAASSRTRVFQYLPLLEQRDIHCQTLTVLPDSQIGGSQILVDRNMWRKLRYYLCASWRTARAGYLAAADHEWEEHLALLIQDATLRRQMGHLSRLVVEAEYSLLRAADVLAATLAAAAGATP